MSGVIMWCPLNSLMRSFIELLVYDSVYRIVEKFLCHIGTTSALLITVGALLNLSKSSFIELLMIELIFSKISRDTFHMGNMRLQEL